MVRQIVSLSLVACLSLAGCGGTTTTSTTSPSPVATTALPSTTTVVPTSTTAPLSAVQEIDVGGYSLDLECAGQGSPTVVFEAGRGGDRSTFTDQMLVLREVTRVCAYDRAGLGTSDERPGTASITLGDLADELALLLERSGIQEPIVLVGFSLGGAVAQFFVDRYPGHVAGLVFVDPVAVPGYVDWFDSPIDDGSGGTIDMERTEADWEEIGPFGDIPLFVLTQNFKGEDEGAPEEFRSYFRDVHRDLAGRSGNAIHLIAVDSGHDIFEAAPDLVTAVTVEVVDAVRSDAPLAPCDDRFAELGANCA